MRADLGKLNFAFALNVVGREGGFKQDVGDHLEADFEIGAEHFSGYAKAVVAAEGIDVPTERLDLARNFVGVARARAFQKEFCHQQAGAIVLKAFGQHATL